MDINKEQSKTPINDPMRDPILPVFKTIKATANETETTKLLKVIHRKDMLLLTDLNLKTISRWASEILGERKKERRHGVEQ